MQFQQLVNAFHQNQQPVNTLENARLGPRIKAWKNTPNYVKAKQELHTENAPKQARARGPSATFETRAIHLDCETELGLPPNPGLR